MFSVLPHISSSPDRHWSHCRPVMSSPLAGPASSPPRSPTSPRYRISYPTRCSQSSPIRPAVESASAPKFRYASRAVRRNPIVQSRQQTQTTRRRLFMQNVRQKREDSQWERRDIEAYNFRTALLAEDHERLKQQLSAPEAINTDADIEDAETWPHSRDATAAISSLASTADLDELIVDDLAQREEQELEAMLEDLGETSLPPIRTTGADSRATQHALSDFFTSSDDDIDQILMELVDGSFDAMDMS